MKKLLALIVLVLGASVAFSQTADLLQKRNSDFDKLTFQVELEKKSYFPFEPMRAAFQVINQTSEPLAASSPLFLLHSSLEVVNPKGDTIKISRLSNTSGGGPELPGANQTLQPSQRYSTVGFISIPPDVFAEPGNYKIQFELSEADTLLKSNVSEVTIKTPQGINKEAFDFLNQHGKDIWFGGDIYETEEGEALIEAFVEKYGASIYAEPAISALANIYRSQGKLEKAKANFKKLESSKNKDFAEYSKRSLIEIERKIEENKSNNN